MLIAFTLTQGVKKETKRETFVEEVTDEHGNISEITRTKIYTDQYTEEEILESLQCFKDSSVYPEYGKGETDLYELKVRRKLMVDGIDADTKYVGFPSPEMKVIFWRFGNKAYGTVYKTTAPVTDDSKWETIYHLYEDLEYDYDCFKVLPEGCSYSGKATDFYSSLCKGYNSLPEHIHKSLIKLSINTNINPETQAADFAECIKKHINTFSVKMECALEGISMDHEYAVEQLEKYA